MLAAVVGLVVGLALGLTGAGGSLLAVPLLIVALELTASDAMGLSLGAVFIASVVGIVINVRQVLWLPASILAFSGMLSAPLGRWVSHEITPWVLVLIFVVLAFWIAGRMWLQDEHTSQTPVRAQRQLSHQRGSWHCQFAEGQSWAIAWSCLNRLLLAGLAIGFLSGLLGVGGGFLIVPTLMALSGITMAQAVASSLFVIASVSFVGALSSYWMASQISFNDQAFLLLGSVLGMLLAYWVNQKVSGIWLQRVFAILIVLSALSMLIMMYAF